MKKRNKRLLSLLTSAAMTVGALTTAALPAFAADDDTADSCDADETAVAEVEEEEESWMLGNVNHDTDVNAGDASLVARYVLDNKAFIDEDIVFDLDLADVNGDGNVDLADVSGILKWYALVSTGSEISEELYVKSSDEDAYFMDDLIRFNVGDITYDTRYNEYMDGNKIALYVDDMDMNALSKATNLELTFAFPEGVKPQNNKAGLPNVRLEGLEWVCNKDVVWNANTRELKIALFTDWCLEAENEKLLTIAVDVDDYAKYYFEGYDYSYKYGDAFEYSEIKLVDVKIGTNYGVSTDAVTVDKNEYEGKSGRVWFYRTMEMTTTAYMTTETTRTTSTTTAVTTTTTAATTTTTAPTTTTTRPTTTAATTTYPITTTVIPVENAITLKTPTECSGTVGDTIQIEYSSFCYNLYIDRISSSDKNVATANKDGVITLVGEGTAEIKVSFAAKGYYYAGNADRTITVNVTAPEVSKTDVKLSVRDMYGQDIEGATVLLEGKTPEGEWVIFTEDNVKELPNRGCLISAYEDSLVWLSGTEPIELSLEDGHYVFHQVEPPSGFYVASDIAFDVKDGKIVADYYDLDSEGTIEMVMEHIMTTTARTTEITIVYTTTTKAPATTTTRATTTTTRPTTTTTQPTTTTTEATTTTTEATTTTTQPTTTITEATTTTTAATTVTTTTTAPTTTEAPVTEPVEPTEPTTPDEPDEPVPDYGTVLSAADKAFKVDEHIRITIENTIGEPCRGYYYIELPEGVEVFTSKGNVVTLKASKPGTYKIGIAGNGCAFTGYITITVEDELPETGYSRLYDMAALAAAMLLITGGAIVAKTKRRDEETEED